MASKSKWIRRRRRGLQAVNGRGGVGGLGAGSEDEVDDVEVQVGVWDRVAARFFDRTGRRVDGEDVRERFEVLDNGVG